MLAGCSQSPLQQDDSGERTDRGQLEPLARAVYRAAESEGGSDDAGGFRPWRQPFGPSRQHPRQFTRSSTTEPRDVAPGPIIEPRWLDVDTAAQYLCMSRHALCHRVSCRQIPFVRRGRIVRFDRQALDRSMSKGVRNGVWRSGARSGTSRSGSTASGIDWTRGTVHVLGKFRKVPHVTPHVLRHTFGTRWLQAGGDVYKLSKILGHSSVAVTEQHYAHLLKEDLVAASQQVKIPVAPRGTGSVVRMPRRRSGTSR